VVGPFAQVLGQPRQRRHPLHDDVSDRELRDLVVEVLEVVLHDDKALFFILLDLLRPTLLMVRFDPDFYRSTYPDLAEAEREGVITDLREHYMNFGYLENRLPCDVGVDGSFYAREYPDVAAAIIEGRMPSAQAHFNATGFAEGRLPRKGWTFRELIGD
jgi:hypothetical protein